MKIRVADEVWIATALLHRRHPDRDDFTVAEIASGRPRARKSSMGRYVPESTYVYQHCVANGVGVSRVYGGPDRFAAFAPGTPPLLNSSRLQRRDAHPDVSDTKSAYSVSDQFFVRTLSV